jgi:light-regulated signal transduction histidine kinase (bacteriophytochrome)
VAHNLQWVAGNDDVFGAELSDGGETLIGAPPPPNRRTAGHVTVEVELQDTVRRLTERTAELERSRKDLEQFAYVTAHDLKAPLGAIEHLAKWIAEDIAATASSETMTNLAFLRGRVARLQALLDGLLAYSRIGRDQWVSEVVYTGAMVQDIVATLKPPRGFVVACVGPMPVIRTHRVPLERVLRNLIGNGLKHHDRREGRIAVSARLDAGVAEFRVSDDGPGIQPQFHDRIFLMFQTLVTRDDLEATGIGLAIVKRHVESHGGQTHIESAPPARGATFAFTWHETVA